MFSSNKICDKLPFWLPLCCSAAAVKNKLKAIARQLPKVVNSGLFWTSISKLANLVLNIEWTFSPNAKREWKSISGSSIRRHKLVPSIIVSRTYSVSNRSCALIKNVVWLFLIQRFQIGLSIILYYFLFLVNFHYKLLHNMWQTLFGDDGTLNAEANAQFPNEHQFCFVCFVFNHAPGPKFFAVPSSQIFYRLCLS